MSDERVFWIAIGGFFAVVIGGALIALLMGQPDLAWVAIAGGFLTEWTLFHMLRSRRW